MNVADSKDLRKFKKKTQFFETPDAIAEQMTNLCGLGRYSKVLEPSAGKGKLIHKLYEEYPFEWWHEVVIHVCEKHEPFHELLEPYCDEIMTKDFLDFEPFETNKEKYDLILMNPPFSNQQAIKHVRHAWDHLKTGGRIVTLLPSGNQVNVLIDEFAGNYNNHTLMDSKFSETNIQTAILTIDKPIEY